MSGFREPTGQDLEQAVPRLSKLPIPKTPEATREQAARTLDLVTAGTIDKVDALIDRMTKLRQKVIDNGERLKSELSGHVQLGKRAGDLSDEIDKELNTLEGDA